MKKRDLNVSFYKSGAGTISTRIHVPKSYLDKLNITQEEREIEVFLDEENQRIIIYKKKK